MNVLLITRWFPPEQHSGTLRTEGFVRHLPEFGIVPIVFTSVPERQQRVGAVSTAMTDDWKEETGAVVSRVPWSGSAPSGATRLLQRFPVGATVALRRARHKIVSSIAGDAMRLMQKYKPEVIYASVSPPETLYLANRLGKATATPVIADLRDPWTYAASSPHRHFVDFLMERAEEGRALRDCQRVIVTTEATRLLVESEIGIPGSRIVVIPNGFDTRAEENISDCSEPLEAGKITVVHLGELSSREEVDRRIKQRVKRICGFGFDPLHTDRSARTPKWFLAACERLLLRKPELRDRLRVWFVGVNNPDRFASFQRFPYPECLRVMPRVPAPQAEEIARRASVLLLLQNQYYLKGKPFCVAIAGKTYTYLKSGRPILAAVQESEMADLVRANGRGRVVPPTDVAALAEALDALIAESIRCPIPDANGHLEQFDRRVQAKLLARELTQVGRAAASAHGLS